MTIEELEAKYAGHTPGLQYDGDFEFVCDELRRIVFDVFGTDADGMLAADAPALLAELIEAKRKVEELQRDKDAAWRRIVKLEDEVEAALAPKEGE